MCLIDFSAMIRSNGLNLGVKLSLNLNKERFNGFANLHSIMKMKGPYSSVIVIKDGKKV